MPNTKEFPKEPANFHYVMIPVTSRKEWAKVSLISAALVTAIAAFAGVVVSIISSGLAEAKEYVVPFLIVLLAGIMLYLAFYGLNKFYRRQRQERERAMGEVQEKEKEFFRKIESNFSDW